MENNRNWAGIAAVILAGLALLVALAGRVGPNFDFSAHVWSSGPQGNTVTSAVPVPNNGQFVLPTVVPPDAPPLVPVMPIKPEAPVPQGKPMMPVPPGKVPFGFGKFGPGHFGTSGFSPFHMVGGFVQLLIFGGLLFLVFRFFRRRQHAFARRPMQGPPPGPPGPPDATPTIQL